MMMMMTVMAMIWRILRISMRNRISNLYQGTLTVTVTLKLTSSAVYKRMSGTKTANTGTRDHDDGGPRV